MIRPDQALPTDPGPPDEDDLIRRAGQGSLEAFGALYERYLPKVYNWVRYTVPAPDVEDVTQEIFIAVMKSLKSFKGQARFSTWLRTLTNRRVADYYRGRDPAEARLNVDVSERERASGPGHDPPAVEDSVVLQAAIRKLPDRYQDLLRLRFAEGLQFHEIAKLSGLSLEGTKSMFRRAIAALRSQLGETNG